MINVSKIKLIIWDLDDTFWEGTLSEGPINPIEENIRLIKCLTDRGIINSICSKNDYEPVFNKLRELGVEEFFVFKSIDWTPKGQRISSLIKEMGLRPVNCLFIDDNVVNLNEAQFYSSDLMIADPSVVADLIQFCNTTNPTDINHKRLLQYKVLEEKQKAKSEIGDNLKFLYASNTKVELHSDCKRNVDRILELINRTNQLNFTKYRSTRDELDALLDDKEATCGYVSVKDNFGDYGIIGFYAIKNQKCVHFLFSCRTIGQGVEQWVYSKLGWPELDVVGTVINKVEKIPAPEWINQDIEIKATNAPSGERKILFKGPCDLSTTLNYLGRNEIDTEFTYIRENSNQTVYAHNHSAFIRDLILPNDQKNWLIKFCKFIDPNIFESKLFKDQYNLIVLSTVLESDYCVFRHKIYRDVKIVLGEYGKPITDNKYWEHYKTVGDAGYIFNQDEIDFICENFEYVGRTTANDYVNFIEDVLSRISHTTYLCLLLGATKFHHNKAVLARHEELNNAIKAMSSNYSNLRFVDVDDYIKSESDFLDSVNHYQIQVYYNIAQKIASIASLATGSEMIIMSKTKYYIDNILHQIIFKLDNNNWFRILCRKLYHLSEKR